MTHDPYNTTNEDAVSNLSMLSTSTMRSSLYFHGKPDRFEQQAHPLADVLELHQDASKHLVPLLIAKVCCNVEL